MRHVRNILGWLFPVVSALVLVAGGCGRQVSGEEIRGLLQALDGREIVIRLDDGSIVRVRVEEAQAPAGVRDLVEKQVRVEVRTSDGARVMSKIEERRGREDENRARGLEDFHFTGVIQSISSDAWVIGTKTFKVDSRTTLDRGLSVGMLARVEFVVLQDGSMLALEIETDAAKEGRFTGTVESKSVSSWVVGGKTFAIDQKTRLRGILDVGAVVKVEFVKRADGSMLATKIEAEEPEDDHFTGKIESKSATQWTIGGKTFKVDASTKLDSGLNIGTLARVEFIRQQDGSLLALEIETAGRDDFHFAGVVQSIGADAWVIGGKTFKVDSNTVIDQGIEVGVMVRVEFVAQPDGSNRATEIETGGQEELRFTGIAERKGADAWVVMGRTFKVNAATRIERDADVGKQVRVDFVRLPDGSDLATRIKEDRQGKPGESRFSGTVEAKAATAWTISGKTFKVDNNTRIDDRLVVGSRVRVEFVIQQDRSFLALRLERDSGGGR
ncbi:MAG: hypothetical protein HYY32_02330 [Chloroflexi bacterium]|nr:hypothetical protein [Chloroflexota bacterium]